MWAKRSVVPAAPCLSCGTTANGDSGCAALGVTVRSGPHPTSQQRDGALILER